MVVHLVNGLVLIHPIGIHPVRTARELAANGGTVAWGRIDVLA